MPSYLITGADGQLGQCFRAVEEEFPHHQLIFANRREVDLIHLETLQNCFDKHPFVGIINCAAYTQVDRVEAEYQKAQKINVELVQNLVIFAQEKSISLVHFSTDYVFDGMTSVPYKENDICSPINKYGQSKYDGELRLEKAKTPHTTIRISGLFSPFGENFVKTILKLSETNQCLKVVNDQWVRPTYGIDLARFVLSNISKSTFFHYNHYQYAQHGINTWYEFAKKIIDLNLSSVNLKACTTEEYPAVAKRPKYSVLDTTRIENHLSLRPLTLEATLEDCIKRIQTL